MGEKEKKPGCLCHTNERRPFQACARNTAFSFNMRFEKTPQIIPAIGRKATIAKNCAHTYEGGESEMGWQDYRAQHEALLYGWKNGEGSHYFIDDRSKTTVWDIARDAQLTYTQEFARERDVQIFAIGIVSPFGELAQGKTGRAVIEDLVQITGGRAFFPHSV